MSTGEKLGLLALIVALSAYLASVRLALLGMLSSQDSGPSLRKKRLIVWMIPADAPLVVAALLLVADLFWTNAPGCLYCWAVGLFVFAVIVLALHHAVSWVISICKWWTHSDGE